MSETPQKYSLNPGETWFMDALGEYLGLESKKCTPDFILDFPPQMLLELLNELIDEALPILVSLAKKINRGQEFFEKVSYSGTTEHLELSNRFFERYESMVMIDDSEINPLLLYLPQDHFEDLVWLESRENFFIAQTIAHINEFLNTYFSHTPIFQSHEQKKAWSWFYSQVLSS